LSNKNLKIMPKCRISQKIPESFDKRHALFIFSTFFTILSIIFSTIYSPIYVRFGYKRGRLHAYFTCLLGQFDLT
jgi:hypothetical protein